jgi:integrase
MGSTPVTNFRLPLALRAQIDVARGDEFDFDAGMLRLRAQLAQDGRTRVPLKARQEDEHRNLPVPDTLMKLVMELVVSLPPGTEYLLCRESDPALPMGDNMIRGDFAAIRKAAGLGDDVTPHVLRHTAATVMIHLGHKVGFVSTKLGHKKKSTTQDIYEHVLDEAAEDRAARVGMDEGFGALIDADPGVVVPLPIAA